jgi:hypothetical protein
MPLFRLGYRLWQGGFAQRVIRIVTSSQSPRTTNRESEW